MALMLAMALTQQEAFQQVLRVAALWYSADGMVTLTGQELIRHAAAILMRVCIVTTAVALGLAAMLRILVRQPPIEEGPITTVEQPRPEESWWSLRTFARITLLVIGLGALIRVPRLFTSFSYDEIFTVEHFAKLPVAHIPFAQAGLNNHLLNSLILHGLLPWSSSEAFLRLPVYAAGVGSLWLFFWVGRQLGGSLVGLFAAALTATSGYHLWYSTLARGYMLGLCASLLALSVLLRASRPPSTRSLVAFVVCEVLAIWAMPTLFLFPIVLLGYVVLGLIPGFRVVLGLDPRSPTALRWVVASLWVLMIAGLSSLPMVPHLVLLATARRPLFSGSFAEASQWLGFFQHPWLLVVGISLLGLGAVTGVWPKMEARGWRVRFLWTAWGLSSLFFLMRPTPSRMHLLTFLGVIFWVAVGLRAMVMAMVSCLKARVQIMVGRALGVTALFGILLTSWGDVTAAVQGRPFQDIRGAVEMAESLLPADGVIVTSRFADQEIAYYAHRPVAVLAPQANLAEFISTTPAFCYLRLHATHDDEDPVLHYFQSHLAPGAILEGSDPLPVWCVLDGKIASLESRMSSP